MMWRYVLLFVCIFTPVLTSAAESDTFRVRLYTDQDTTPPTTPVISSVTPTSATTIDVVWAASTDDVLLDGYQVIRDSVQIATTTLTTYTDSGLTASTTYSYEIRAFDWQNNFSSTSAAVATTTEQTPVVATSTPTTTPSSGGGGASGVVVLQDFAIETFVSGAELQFETNRPSRYVLRWGRTDAYTGGYIASDTFRFNHITTITGLEPGTRYQYELIGFSPAGIEMVLREGAFTTEALADTVPPANVIGLSAEAVGDDVLLSWRNPSNPDLASIRVVRNHQFFPTDPQNGVLVYQGLGESFRDRDALAVYPGQYYTVYTIDRNGNVSSGALVFVAGADEIDSTETTPPLRNVPEGFPATTSLEASEDGEPATYGGLEPDQIQLRQGSTESDLTQPVTLSHQVPFVVSVPFAAVPRHLKSIIVTIGSAEGSLAPESYLLKITPDQSAYETVIEPSGVLGTDSIVVHVYDFEAQMVSFVSQRFTYADTGARDPVPAPVVFPDQIANYSVYGILSLLCIVLLLALYWFLVGRKRNEDEDERVQKQASH